MQYTAEIISDVIWPLAIVIGILVLREPIVDKIRDLNRFRFKDVEAFWDQKLDQVGAALEETEQQPAPVRVLEATGKAEISFTAEATGTVVPPPEEGHPEPSKRHHLQIPFAFDDDTYSTGGSEAWGGTMSMASIDPAFAVHEAGARLDQSLLRIASGAGLLRSPKVVARYLIQEEVIPANLASSIMDLLTLRDQAAYSTAFPLSIKESLRFVDSTRKVSGYLDEIQILPAPVTRAEPHANDSS